MKKLVFLIFFFLIATSLFATDWYVRPAGGAYGAEDGTSYAAAWDGLLNVVWGGAGVVPGDTLYICGTHIHTMPNSANLLEGILQTGQNRLVPKLGMCLIKHLKI